MIKNAVPQFARRARGFPLRRQSIGLAGVVVAVGLALSACGGSSSSATLPAPPSATIGVPSATASATGAATGSTGGQVLPVTANPINNASTNQTLTIDSVLVENNVDAAGLQAADHLEIALSNAGTTDLAGVEVYYTFDDPITGQTESYYSKLPESFTIPAAGSRIAHFDDTGKPDHFAVNNFSLYYLDTNAMDVTVEVSAADAAPQTMMITKDAGGPETAD